MDLSTLDVATIILAIATFGLMIATGFYALETRRLRIAQQAALRHERGASIIVSLKPATMSTLGFGFVNVAKAPAKSVSIFIHPSGDANPIGKWKLPVLFPMISI